MELFHVLIELGREKRENAVFNVVASINDETNAITSKFLSEEVFAPSFFIHTSVSQEVISFTKRGGVLEAYCSENSQTTEEGKSRFKLEYGKIIPVAYIFKSGWKESGPESLYSEVAKRGLVAFLSDALFFPYNEQHGILYDGVKLKNNTVVPYVGKELDSYSIDNNELMKLVCKFIPSGGFSGFGELLIVPKSSIEVLRSFPQCGKTDMMTYSQLSDWLKRRLANTSEVDAVVLREFLRKIQSESSEESDSLIKQRLTRCMCIMKSDFLTDDDFKWIFESKHYPVLKLEDQINKRKSILEEEIKTELTASVEAQKEEILQRAKTDSDKIRKETEEQIEAVRSELIIDEAKLNEIKEAISAEREELSVIQSDKLKIINEIRIVAGIGQKVTENEYNPCDYYTDSNGTKTVDVDNPDELYKIIKARLDTKYRKAISEILYHQWSLVPDVTWAHILAHCCGNCCVKTITVEHGWYSFDHFISAGLIAFWNHAWDNEEKNHILILQNINIIPPECALQSLLDLANEKSPKIPNSRKSGVPENLRIVATVLPCKDESSIGLSLKYDSFKNWQVIGDRLANFNMRVLEQTKAGEYKIDFNSIDIRPCLSNESEFLQYVEY